MQAYKFRQWPLHWPCQVSFQTVKRSCRLSKPCFWLLTVYLQLFWLLREWNIYRPLVCFPVFTNVWLPFIQRFQNARRYYPATIPSFGSHLSCSWMWLQVSSKLWSCPCGTACLRHCLMLQIVELLLSLALGKQIEHKFFMYLSS